MFQIQHYLDSQSERTLFSVEGDVTTYFRRFEDDECLKNLKVNVIEHGDLTVEFCSSQERDEEKMLCELEVELPPRSSNPSDPDVSEKPVNSVDLKMITLKGR